MTLIVTLTHALTIIANLTATVIVTLTLTLILTLTLLSPPSPPSGVIFRSVRPLDCSGVTLTLHYLETGGVTARFSARRQEFFLPVTLLLKALTGMSDRLLWENIVRGETGNRFLTDHMELLLKDHASSFGVDTPTQCRCYLGRKFRSLLGLPDTVSDESVGMRLLSEYVLVHLEDDGDKAACLCLMVRKLFAFVSGKCCVDNADAPANQELLLPGHLYLMVLKVLS